MSNLKSVGLTRSTILSKTGVGMSDHAYNNNYSIMPLFKGGRSNVTVRSGSGDYDGGDRVMGFPNGYEIDGDLLFTTGWGDGFAVRRLNNDGSMTRLFYDASFLWRDTTLSYTNMLSVAIDKTNKLGVVMSYNVNGYTTFDYSECVNGGTTFVKHARPSHSNPQYFIGSQNTSNGYIRAVGTSYTSGLVAAGEWIYAGEYNTAHYRRVMRRNLNTGTEQIIGNASGTNNLYSGSATIDRDGYRYTLTYDEVNDRVFYFSYTNGNFILVVDASTVSPKLVWCDMGDAGQGANAYDQGLFIPDPVNSPNRMWIGGQDRFNDIDITPCFTGSAPTIHNTTYTNNYFPNNPYARLGTKYQKTSGVPMDKVPSYPNFIPISADRGWVEASGWIDTTNNHCAGFTFGSNLTEDTTTGGRGSSLNHDYSCPMVLMESANSTKYWVKMGYGGSDGNLFITYAENVNPNELIGNWELIFGTYTLANSANVDCVSVPDAVNFSLPSGTSLTVYVSNNNGSTWETYDKNSDAFHVFTSSGTQLRVKFSASGQPDKAPYYLGNYGAGPIKVMYGSLHKASKDSNIKFKINRKRLGTQ